MDRKSNDADVLYVDLNVEAFAIEKTRESSRAQTETYLVHEVEFKFNDPSLPTVSIDPVRTGESSASAATYRISIIARKRVRRLSSRG